MSCIIKYSDRKNIEKDIRKFKLIPFRVSLGTKYEACAMYYTKHWGTIFRVTSVEYDDNGELQGAFINYDTDFCGLLSTELNQGDYRLRKDFHNIYKKNIINSNKIYYGAEIVYWFFMNNITSKNPVYKGFWKFVDDDSRHRIADTTRYKISADIDPKTGYYIHCKIKKIHFKKSGRK